MSPIFPSTVCVIISVDDLARGPSSLGQNAKAVASDDVSTVNLRVAAAVTSIGLGLWQRLLRLYLSILCTSNIMSRCGRMLHQSVYRSSSIVWRVA
eukprot:scaffold95433_cov23-Cyclotella_meneghiniana.AAC.1